MKKCKDILNKMSLYIDKFLNEEELEDFKNHIKECNNCKKELKSLEGLVERLKNLEKFKVPENFHEDLINKIKKIKKRKENNFYKLSLIAASLIIFLFLNNFLILFISQEILNKEYKNYNDCKITRTIEEKNLNSISNFNTDNVFIPEKENEDIYINTKLEIKTENLDKTIFKLKNFLNIKDIKTNKKDKYLYIDKYINLDEYNNITKNLDSLGVLVYKQDLYNNQEDEDEINYSISLYNKEKEKLTSLLDTYISEEDKETVKEHINKLSEIIENKSKDLNIKKDKVYLSLKIEEYNFKNIFYLDLKKNFYQSFLNRSNFIIRMFSYVNTIMFVALILIVFINFIFYFLKRRIKYDK